MSWTGINWTSDFPRMLADVTGDGRADIVGFGLDGVWISRNDGQGNFLPPERGLANFGFNQSWRVDKHVRATGDFGDPLRPFDHVSSLPRARVRANSMASRVGRLPRIPGADLVGFGDDGVWTALSHGDGQFLPATLVLDNMGYQQGWRSDQHPRIVTDLNADGFSDLVGFGDDGVWTALSHGDGTFAAASFVLENLGVKQGWRIDRHPRMLADLTGNKHPDIVAFGDDGIWVALSNGAGGFGDAQFMLRDFGYNQGWRTDVHERIMASLGGNGAAGFVGFGDEGVWVALSNGNGTFAPAKLVLRNLGANQGWRTDRHPRMLVDLTGNGHCDIVGMGDDGVWTAMGNGDGSFSDARFVLPNFGVNQGWTVKNHPRFLADTTGDGRPDIVGFGNDGVWVAVNNGDGTFSDARFVLKDFGFTSGQTAIKHVFVLMLENRSFDHFLGYSDLTGTDALTGLQKAAEGLSGQESNIYEFQSFTVSENATDRIDPGPEHNFNDVLIQLCGPEFDNVNLDGKPYPAVNGTGYAAAYGIMNGKDLAGEVMKCFAPNNLKVLNQLAQEFVVCDHWFSSMAGPTEPNRMFVHAATSGTWDDSPSHPSQFWNEVFDGLEFKNGTIYDRMREADVPFRIYAGDDFPNVALLDSISLYTDVDSFDDFEGDINDDDFDAAYTFIEPNYDVVLDPSGFSEGNSQHPPGSVAEGEKLIKQVYEIIRKSPRWGQSLLLIVWDEHGGFYDHVLPPRATPTGERGDMHGFMFDQLGPRVPAVVISPLIPKNMIESRTLEHSVIPATLEQLFSMSPLTVRDAGMIGLQSLATLQTPRTDTPLTLDEVVTARVGASPVTPPIDLNQPLVEMRDEASVRALRIIIKEQLKAAPQDAAQIKARVAGLKTVMDLKNYFATTIPIIRAKRIEARKQRVASRRVRMNAHR